MATNCMMKAIGTFPYASIPSFSKRRVNYLCVVESVSLSEDLKEVGAWRRFPR